ncbi:MAG TPA: adenylate/guanylate cyclase domain-containing protein [Verrucomicrobiae bacterium]|nr:adenylate/guanylate cyclase domain-containing protein [Verrucomicrobiae bacterium]
MLPWFFCFVFRVILKPVKLIPGLVALGVILVVSVASCLRLDFFERLERMTFDMRVREALRFSPIVDTNLGFVFIDEDSIRSVRNGSLGYRFGLYWPRQVYARVIQELADQGAGTIAFDVIFGELRPFDGLVKLSDGSLVDSDTFFATEVKRAGNVVLPITQEVTPPDLFLTNAAAVADISTDKDSDGILRRAKAFRLYRHWHQVFRQMEADPDFGVDLHKARIEPRRIVLPRSEGGDITVPLDPGGNFDLADFIGTNIPPGLARWARPFQEERAWHMGLVIAARQLGVDLSAAQIDLANGRIVLRGKNGVERIIPVDKEAGFFIDWCLPPSHPKLARQAIQDLLLQNKLRSDGQTNGLENRWAGKSVVIGSAAVLGNDLTDRGATPLQPDTLLVSKHWNVANSVITGRFVRRAPLVVELGLIALLGIVASIATWQLRALPALVVVVLIAAAYVAVAALVYVNSRYWLPIALPVLGALIIQYLCQVTWMVVFEQAERRRIRSVFSTMVSPKIVNELLQAKTLELGGVRREITVFFADVRGFTTLTDSSQEHVAEYVRSNNLSGAAAEAAFDQQARETLNTVNIYLGVIAHTIIQHDGTLDKFIGDCVMAFWGAPTPNPRHAISCVQAAIEAQRAIYQLNCERKAENQKRSAENQTRAAAGLPAHPLLPILFLGTGVNTGVATVGLMGSASQAVVRQGSYTVFGREVNLASRLEGLSGRGHIYISESTYEHLRRHEPALAATCVALPPVNVKGIRTAVQVYEVPWRAPDALPLEEEFASASVPDTTAFVSLSQRTTV